MGYFDNQGLPATKVTWANPTIVPESKRQSGGWYYNPSSGYVDRWWSGNTSTPAATSSSTSSGGTVDYQKLLNDQTAARQAENARLKAEQDAVLGKYTSAVAAQTPLTTAAEQKSQALGIPGLNTQLATTRQEVQNVKGLLSTLESDITARTSGQLLSEPQRRRLLAYEETPLRTQLGSLLAGQESAAGQLGQAYTQLGSEMTWLTAEQKRTMAPYELEVAMFSDRAARESTGFDKTAENNLSLILTKIKNDQALTENEWKNASDLAKIEAQYVADAKLANLKANLEKANTVSDKPTTDELKSAGLGIVIDNTGSVVTNTTNSGAIDTSKLDQYGAVLNPIWETYGNK